MRNSTQEPEGKIPIISLMRWSEANRVIQLAKCLMKAHLEARELLLMVIHELLLEVPVVLTAQGPR